MTHTFKAGLSATPEIGEALARVERALNDAQPDFTFATLHAAPKKTWSGMTVLADGTDWNPGSGQGVYTFYASAWHKLG